jgi:dihydroorotate dehydrogenase
MRTTTVVWSKFLEWQDLKKIQEKVQQMSMAKGYAINISYPDVDRDVETSKQTTKRYWHNLTDAQEWIEFVNTFDPPPLSAEIDPE